MTRMPVIQEISIHAPRTGSDVFSTTIVPSSWVYFNPRSPHGERHVKRLLLAIHQEFQSTLPARGATRSGERLARAKAISIHAPRTGSDLRSPGDNRACGISIHAPRTGSDDTLHLRVPCNCSFQSTLPARGATSFGLWYSDNIVDFNPRSPHGERQCRVADGCPCNPFQSTLPARGATRIKPLHRVGVEISIHAPRTGSDLATFLPETRIWKFQSTLPARGATALSAVFSGVSENFNPRSPHGERPSPQSA